MQLSKKKFPLDKSETEASIVFLNQIVKNPNIIVGDYTYYDAKDKPENFEKFNVVFGVYSKLVIGKFCQIAHGTKFILNDANHQMDGFSTYPFFVFGKWSKGQEKWAEYTPNLPDKGDTIIGNDVWFCHESVIMPGVKVGDGAIIGSRAVVTKDVPPYSIVGGNPAKVIRKRFSDEIIEKLLEIKWWDWEYEKISQNIPAIVGADIDKLNKAI